jgi:type IV pilus assembly protein PilA
MKTQTQQGFTLIELMIVIAIIGILASIAVPQFQSYTARSQVSEAVTLLSGLKQQLAEYCADKGAMPTTLSDFEFTSSGQYVGKVKKLTASGIAITLQAKMKSTGVSKKVQKKTVKLGTTDCGVTWKCEKGDIENKYLPGACK